MSSRLPPPDLAIVVPTFNESQNVVRLVELLDSALSGVNWEVVFVDDNSPDRTAELVRRLAQRDGRVRCVHRVGRRGLSSACIEGIMATSTPYVAVMDADLQHDETRLPVMLDELRRNNFDIVVGSRYLETGGVGDWNRRRQWMSQFATRLSWLATRIKLQDPMSGFFMVRREIFLEAVPSLSAIGFKILLDLLASLTRPPNVKEVPYVFRSRHLGESKLDALVLWEYLLLLLDKTIGHVVPVRFISFALIGGVGVVVHFLILTLLFKGWSLGFAVAQSLATMFAISSNFFLNNVFTYRDRRLKGWALLGGWVTFNLVCATGATANVGVATWLFERQTLWVFSALAGIAIGVVWNYAMSSIFTWRKR